MTKFEAVDDVRKALVEMTLAYKASAGDDESLQVFHDSYLQLVERFYRENSES